MGSLTSRDIYWIAGLLEGEGCFSFYKSESGPKITCAMTDRDVLEKLNNLVTGTIRTKKYLNPKHKTVYYWRVTSRKAIGLMMTIYSLMGTRRQSKIKETIQYWKSRGSHPSFKRKDRVAHIKDMRYQGLTFSDIGKNLGISKQSVIYSYYKGD